jgi:hypothetical protein
MKKQLLFLVLIFLTTISYSQTTGDYRTKGNAYAWATITDWEVYSGTAWQTATAIPDNTVIPKPSKITIVTPTTPGAIFYMNTGSGDMKTTNLIIQDGVIFQQGYDQSFSTYLSMYSVIINAGGVFRVPTTGLLSGTIAYNDDNGGVRNHSFYTQQDLLVSTANGTVNPNPGKFIGTYTFSHTPDANGSYSSYTQKLIGYLGNGTHPPASANVIYPPTGGSPSWNMYGTVLPLKLISFDAVLKLNDAYLNWTTLDETNFSKFEVEKSVDGKNFSLFKTVSGKNTKTINFYSLQDQNLSSGSTYYRLKMIDNDGTFIYSDIKAVNNKSFTYNIYPNPVSDILNLQFPTIKSSGIIIISDISGKVINKIDLGKGISNFEINVNNLKSNSYIVQIETDGNKYVKQFIKL